MLRVTAENEDYTTCVNGALVVQIWHQNTSLEGVQKMAEAIRQQVAANGKVFWLVITTTPKAPESAARDAIAEAMASQRDHVAGCALVFEGAGFAAATVRAVVTGLTMISRNPFPYKVFADVDQAVQWFRTLPMPRAIAALMEASDDIAHVRKRHAIRYEVAV